MIDADMIAHEQLEICKCEIVEFFGEQILDETVSESFVYDSMNRVSEYNDIFGNVVGYEYNQNGRLKAVILGDDVKYIYDYDKLGRPKAESRLSGDIENKIYYDYDELGIRNKD